MLSFLVVQFGGGRLGTGRAGVLEPLILSAFVVCIGAVAVPMLGLMASSSRDVVRGWRGRRRRLRTATNAELRARAMMSELCPHGWRAQITVLSSGESGGSGGSGESGGAGGLGESAGSGASRRERVALEWTELQDESGRPAVMRRVVAPTIGEALEAMVADRRTDQTLEQIEQGAVADGILWPDV